MFARKFVEGNIRLSKALSKVWPYRPAHGFSEAYVSAVKLAAATTDARRVVDVGARRATPYADALPEGIELVGVDLRAEDLDANESLDVRVACDVLSDGLPDEAKQADVATSRWVLEHISDMDLFAATLFAALAPGGRTVHLFAGRWSLFAILNRLLPRRAARRVLSPCDRSWLVLGGSSPTMAARTLPRSRRSSRGQDLSM